MLRFFLYLRILLVLLASPVLVLSNLHGDGRRYKESPIVTTYMSSNNIQWKNWMYWEDWLLTGACDEVDEKELKTPFTKVYLWEDNAQWIYEDREWDDFFKKLEQCQHIIEIIIDGGCLNERRNRDPHFSADDSKKFKNYAEKLVTTLKQTKKKDFTITWYDNSVYGMDWSFGQYKDTTKFTWKKKDRVYDTKKQDVPKKTFEEFYKMLISTTCRNTNAVCIGILAAYSPEPILCETIIGNPIENSKLLLKECESTFSEYREDRGNELRKIDLIEPLVEYLKSLKKQRNVHGEL